MKQLIKILLSTLMLCSCSIFFFTDFRQYLDAAEKAEKEQNYKEAIQQYKGHIIFRKSDSGRFKDENPYFYQLMIGDLYIKLKNPESAEKAFLIALKHNISPPLCAERLRRIGTYYLEEKKYEEAFAILRKHRELDPLLFDLEIDKVHKASIGQEENF